MKMSSLKDYAALCGLPIRTLRRFCQEGILPAMKIGRVYYVDTQAADQALRESVNLTTAKQKAAPDIKVRASGKKFDFMKEINRLKQAT
jgi:hypothetical protein